MKEAATHTACGSRGVSRVISSVGRGGCGGPDTALCPHSVSPQGTAAHHPTYRRRAELQGVPLPVEESEVTQGFLTQSPRPGTSSLVPKGLENPIL